MASPPGRPASLSRRRLLAALRGLAAAPLLGSPETVQSRDAPPVFRTSRFQFTELRPLAEFRPVELVDLAGRTTRLAPVRGKVLVVNFWATWCAACRTELPTLERFLGAVGDRVNVAAVPTDTQDREKVRRFLGQVGVRNLSILLDPERRLASTSEERPAPFMLYGMPITYVIDGAGRIAGYIAGAADWLSEDAQRLVAYYASL